MEKIDFNSEAWKSFVAEYAQASDLEDYREVLDAVGDLFNRYTSILGVDMTELVSAAQGYWESILGEDLVWSARSSPDWPLFLEKVEAYYQEYLQHKDWDRFCEQEEALASSFGWTHDDMDNASFCSDEEYMNPSMRTGWPYSRLTSEDEI